MVGSLGYEAAMLQEHSHHRLVYQDAPDPTYYDIPIPYASLKHQPTYQQLEYSSVEHPEHTQVQYVHAVEEPEYVERSDYHYQPTVEHYEHHQGVHPHYVTAHEHTQVEHPHHVAHHEIAHHHHQIVHSHQEVAHTHHEIAHHHHEGQSNPHDAHAEINSSETLVKSNGEYAYGFDTSNGIAKTEAGVAGHSVKGSSQHITPEGEVVTLKYVADKNGFHAVGSHIPTPPPLPQHVIETLAWNAAHPEEEEEDHLYDHEGHYHKKTYHHDHYHHGHQHYQDIDY